MSSTVVSMPSMAMLIHSESGYFDVWYQASNGQIGPRILPQPLNVSTHAWPGTPYLLDIEQGYGDTFFFDLTIIDADDAFGQLYSPAIYGWDVTGGGGMSWLLELIKWGDGYYADLSPGQYWIVPVLMPTPAVLGGLELYQTSP